MPSLTLTLLALMLSAAGGRTCLNIAHRMHHYMALGVDGVITDRPDLLKSNTALLSLLA